MKAEGDEEVREVLRVIDPVFKPVMEEVIRSSLVPQQGEMVRLLTHVLQYTDGMNYSSLSYLASMESSSYLKGLEKKKANLEMLFRLFDAQPYLMTVWDCSPLFAGEDAKPEKNLAQDPQASYLLRYLRHMIVPENKTLSKAAAWNEC